jgi:hypothetical protein
MAMLLVCTRSEVQNQGNVWTWSSQKMLTYLSVKLTPLAKHFSKCVTQWKLHGVTKCVCVCVCVCVWFFFNFVMLLKWWSSVSSVVTWWVHYMFAEWLINFQYFYFKKILQFFAKQNFEKKKFVENFRINNNNNHHHHNKYII